MKKNTKRMAKGQKTNPKMCSTPSASTRASKEDLACTEDPPTEFSDDDTCIMESSGPPAELPLPAQNTSITWKKKKGEIVEKEKEKGKEKHTEKSNPECEHSAVSTDPGHPSKSKTSSLDFAFDIIQDLKEMMDYKRREEQGKLHDIEKMLSTLRDDWLCERAEVNEDTQMKVVKLFLTMSDAITSRDQQIMHLQQQLDLARSASPHNDVRADHPAPLASDPPTFAEVLKSSPTRPTNLTAYLPQDVCHIIQTNKDFSVTLEPNSNLNTVQDIEKEMRKNINPIQEKIAILRVSRNKKNGLLISCKSQQDLEKFQQRVNEVPAIREKAKIIEHRKRKPRIIIMNVCKNIQKEELSSIILEQNNMQADESEMKVLFPIKAGAFENHWIVEVTPHLLHVILPMEKLLIGWSACRVEFSINMLHCYTCHRIGHTMRNCPEKHINQIKCAHCNHNHPSNECTSSVYKCINCTEANEKYKLNLNTSHSSLDVRRCSTIHFHKTRIISRIDFGL